MTSQSSDVILLGSTHSAGTLRLQQFLTRNSYPFVNLDIDSENSVRDLLERFEVRVEDLPVVVCRHSIVLKNPSNEEVAANITLHVRTEITALEGEDQFARVAWKTAGNEPQTHDIGHVFLMMGALPCTGWLNSCIALNDKGFVRTGPDLLGLEPSAAKWRNGRQPEFFESSIPGIFAVGDVRCGSVKRVAAAVGEGSVCIQQVHRGLHEGADA